MTRSIDLRSDTVTQPTPAMRAAIAAAVVGDDGHDEDPTVAALEARFATITGKESAVFVPSGVMGNQIALRILSAPGDIVVAGHHQHVVAFEFGAAARNSGVQFALVNDDTGQLNADDVAALIDAERDHQPHVSMVTVENSHMFSGGAVWTARELADFAVAIGDRPIHLDGARLFNAVVATGDSAAELSAPATTVMCCLSKGLCAPVGSLLAGPRELMAHARVERKRLGGSMRQSGFLAAAGLVALDDMVERLGADHLRAQRLAQVVARRFPESEYDPESCRTNIVAFTHPRARYLIARCAEHGVLGDTLAANRARFVTHADIDDAAIDRACDVLASLTLT